MVKKRFRRTKRALAITFTTLTLFAGTTLLPKCEPIHPSKVPIPEKIEGLKEHVENIDGPEDFKIFEPMIAAITGFDPVESEDVHFLPKSKVVSKIWFDDGDFGFGCWSAHTVKGCYRFLLGDILLEDNPELGFLFKWAHEQGHRMADEINPGELFSIVFNQNKLVSELKADMLALYLFEYIAKHHDRDLGMCLLTGQTSRRLIFGMIPSEQYEAFIRNSLDDPDRGYHFYAMEYAFAIMASRGLNSFGEVWYFLSTNDDDIILDAIKKGLETWPIEKELSAMKSLAGERMVQIPDDFKFNPDLDIINLKEPIPGTMEFYLFAETGGGNFNVSADGGDGELLITGASWSIYIRGSVVRFRTKDFCYPVELPIGSDEAARVIFIANSILEGSIEKLKKKAHRDILYVVQFSMGK